MGKDRISLIRTVLRVSKDTRDLWELIVPEWGSLAEACVVEEAVKSSRALTAASVARERKETRRGDVFMGGRWSRASRAGTWRLRRWESGEAPCEDIERLHPATSEFPDAGFDTLPPM